MAGESYEGWPNRETWALNLWLTNDEDLYNQARGYAADPDEGERALRDWVEDELWPHLHRTSDGLFMMGDVGSLWRVEWVQVAESLRA